MSTTPAAASETLPARVLASLDALDRYIAAHGHPHAPRGAKDPLTGADVGAWLNRQRQAHRAGTLSLDVEEALRARGVALDADEVRAVGKVTPAQQQAYAALKAGTTATFLAEARRLVAAGYDLNAVGTEAGTDTLPNFGRRLAEAHRDHAAGTLDPALAAALAGLGLRWKSTNQRRHRGARTDLLDRLLPALAQFTAAHGHTDVPSNHRTPEGYHLYDAVRRLRLDGSNARLDDATRTALVTGGIAVPHPGDPIEYTDAILTEFLAAGFPHADAVRWYNHAPLVPAETAAGLRDTGWSPPQAGQASEALTDLDPFLLDDDNRLGAYGGRSLLTMAATGLTAAQTTACFRAGLTPAEVLTRHRDGTLDLTAVAAMAALRDT